MGFEQLGNGVQVFTAVLGVALDFRELSTECGVAAMFGQYTEH
jgi:hypothetical protein